VTGFVKLGLAGTHQKENARLAAGACEIIARSHLPFASRITGRSVARGLSRVQTNTRLRARMQALVRNGVPVLFDVAHNPDGIRALTQSLRGTRFRHPVVLFGVMKDKDADAMLKLLTACASSIVGVVPSTGRAMSARELAKRARSVGATFSNGGTVHRGLRIALRLARQGFPLVVTGSHYVAAEAIPLLEKKRPKD
jgi:dihydrofolate synthase/folylpolyglutamate synthase